MATALISDIATASKYVRLNFNLNQSAIADMAAAEQRFLLPILGDDLYQTLLDEVGETESDYADLIEKCRAAEAPLAYWFDLPYMHTQITDGGIKTQSNDNMQAAHRWEYDNLRDGLADKGCFALEQLIKHLFQWQEFYNWTIPGNYNLIFQSGEDFSKYFPLKEQPYRVFESLRVIIQQQEDNVIIPAIGQALLDELKAASVNNATPDTNSTKAIELIKKAVANLTIKTAIETLSVNIGINGFTVLLGRPAQRSFDGEESAGNDPMTLLYNSVSQTGMNYLEQLISYLNATASNEIFVTFFTSDLYVAPVVEDDTDVEGPLTNETRTGVFGF